MKVHAQIDQQGFKIDEVFSGANADAVVGQMKARVAKEMGFAMKLAINAMPNVSFVREVVKRYAEGMKKTLPEPTSCEHFLQIAQEEKLVTVLEA